MTYSRPVTFRVENAAGLPSGSRTACASIASIRTEGIVARRRIMRKCVCVKSQLFLRYAVSPLTIVPMHREPAVAVRRSTAILLALASDEALEAGGLGVKRLADLTGNDISRISRTLDVLAESRLVERDPANLGYRLGWRFFALAARAGDLQLRLLAPRFVRQLTDEFGERAFLSVLDGREVLTVVSESPTHTIQ